MTSPATGIVLGDRYRLQERIASGGMGTVWRAEDETLHRKVAVKVLNEGLSADERFTERFRREARASAGLSHPKVASVLDYGEEDGRPYIVMELIDGETLAQRLERVGRLEPDETAVIGAAVAETLAYAHAAGIVHRDVKPANIMLTPEGEVKVCDFGIAAPLEGATGLTATGAVMGTSRYISPEQVDGIRATPASDVYSLGVVLYEALAGEPPFARETPVATAMAHLNEPPEPLREVRPEVPEGLAALVHRCLSKDPAARPSPQEVAAELSPSGRDPGSETVPIAMGSDTDVLGPVEPVVRRDGEPTRRVRLGFRGPPGTMRPDRPRRERRLRWLIAAGGVAVLIVIVALVSSGSGHVNVPRFVGLTRHHARVRAEKAGLVPRFRPVESNQPRGTVVNQIPRSGVSVFSGAPVRLLVSSGPPPVTPPPPPKGKGPPEGKGKGHGKEKH